MNVFIIAALTADGFIARNQNDRSFDWTSVEDKAFYVSSIKRAKAVVMGAKTFATFTRYPKGNKYVVYTSNPKNHQNPKPEVIETLFTKQAPELTIKQLEQEGYSEVAICGGSSIYSMFMKSGLVTKLYLTIEPKLFGKGIGLFSEELDVNLKLVDITKLSDQSVVLEYDVLAP